MGAQAVMQRLATLDEEISTWRDLEAQTASLAELLELSMEEGAGDVADDIARETAELTEKIGELEFQLVFSGPHDDRSAIFAIHAGAGGSDSQDWAQMLLRMYLRWAERKKCKTTILETSPGEETGIKSATVEVTGPFAYGWLKVERGVHRLVRLSPFDADHLRHTSFALVEVLPEADGNLEVQINSEDLRIDTYRASGHGGQNVQKLETAVRITHLPTGIVVTCQNERSQGQNRDVAMKVLQARLIDREEQIRAEEQAKIKGAHVSAGWGNQIRSYVLHPYKMVKDHRSGYQTSDSQAVLDGEIDELLRAELMNLVGQEDVS
jgi:peptide chain release factor 2